MKAEVRSLLNMDVQDWSEHKPEYFKYKGRWIDNEWLSNMSLHPVKIGNNIYPSVENYFQGMKTLKLKEREKFLTLSPKESKALGRKVPLRKDWERIKHFTMYIGVLNKFMGSEDLKEKLLNTGDSVLVEWNNWNDLHWGADYQSGLGVNLLGQILMLVREELRSI